MLFHNNKVNVHTVYTYISSENRIQLTVLFNNLVRKNIQLRLKSIEMIK